MLLAWRALLCQFLALPALATQWEKLLPEASVHEDFLAVPRSASVEDDLDAADEVASAEQMSMQLQQDSKETSLPQSVEGQVVADEMSLQQSLPERPPETASESTQWLASLEEEGETPWNSVTTFSNYKTRPKSRITGSSWYANWGYRWAWMANNDPFGEIYFNLAQLQQMGITHDTPVANFVSVAGSMAGLNVLLQAKPKSAVLLDMNAAQLALNKMTLTMVQHSASPQSFISRVFGRNLAEFEKTNGKLTAANQQKFLALPPDPAVREKVRTELPEDLHTEYDKVLGRLIHMEAFEKEMGPLGLIYPAFDLNWKETCSGTSNSRITSGVPCTCVKSGLGARAPTCYIPDSKEGVTNRQSFYYGEGWLSDQTAFDKLKAALPDLKFAYGKIFDLDWKQMCTGGAGVGIMYMMDIAANDYIGVTPKQWGEWKKQCGSEKLILLSSINVEKKQLCQLVQDDGSMLPCPGNDKSNEELQVMGKSLAERLKGLTMA